MAGMIPQGFVAGMWNRMSPYSEKKCRISFYPFLGHSLDIILLLPRIKCLSKIILTITNTKLQFKHTIKR